MHLSSRMHGRHPSRSMVRALPYTEHSHAPYAALGRKTWEEAGPSAFTVSHTDDGKKPLASSSCRACGLVV